jgi:hypothetical protein
MQLNSKNKTSKKDNCWIPLKGITFRNLILSKKNYVKVFSYNNRCFRKDRETHVIIKRRLIAFMTFVFF